MIGAALKLGPWAAVGFLIGLLAIWWVQPETTGGIALLILIGVMIGSIIGSVVKYFLTSSKSPPENGSS